MAKNAAAQTLAAARWAKTTPEQRQAYARKIVNIRWSKAPAKKRARKVVSHE